MTTKRKRQDPKADIRSDLRARLIAKDITPERADELLALADAKARGTP